MKKASKEMRQKIQHMLASSTIIEGNAWTVYPVRGGLGMMQNLMWNIELHKSLLP